MNKKAAHNMTNNSIHPAAIIHEKAIIADGVEIGPYSLVGPNVSLGKGVKLHSHVVVEGYTTIGENTEIFPFASIGHAPQDLKFKGEKSTVEIGSNNIIREYVTIHPGTQDDKMVTKIGDNCLFMVSSHIAHDCIIGNNVILANNATLGGHVEIGDHAIIGGLSAIHQFVRIGKHAMIGGMSGIENDVIPYGQASGERANLVGLNLIGIRRRGFEREEIKNLRNAFKDLFMSEDKTFQERIAIIAEKYKDSKNVMDVITFMNTKSSRPLCRPKNKTENA